MKLSLDYKKLHLRFYCGIGFVLFILKTAIKNKAADVGNYKPPVRQIKKCLKDFKHEYGTFTLAEIEDKDGAKIVIKV